MRLLRENIRHFQFSIIGLERESACGLESDKAEFKLASTLNSVYDFR